VVLLLVLLPVALPLLPPPLTSPLLRRRKRVRCLLAIPRHSPVLHFSILTTATEKEESDDDMGFGLFD
jgi:hypothetical protein